MNRPPTFSGRSPDRYSVDQFIGDMNLYFAMANHPINRKIIVFDAAIQQPAKRHFEAKLIADNFGVRAHVAGDDANDGTQEAYFQLQYTARIAWLQAEYNGVEQQRLARAQLFRNKQKNNESPRDFYHRIEEQLERSGLPVAQNDVTLEQIFLQGLHKDISLHVRILPLNTLDRMLKAAENYWMILNDQNYIDQTPATTAGTVPRKILTNPRFYKEDPPAQNPRMTYQEPQWYQDAPQEPKPDPVMDELVQQMAQLRAHVVQLEARKYQRPPRDTSERRYYSQLDPEDQYRHRRMPNRNFGTQGSSRGAARENQDYNRRNGQCFKCGEEGHFAKECTTEMERPAVPSNQQDNRRSETRRVNTVRQFYVRDSDSGSQSDQEDSQWNFQQEDPRPRTFRRSRPIYRPGTITDDERESSEERPTAFTFPVTVKKDKATAKPYERKVRPTRSFPDFETKPRKVETPEPMEAENIPFSESIAEEDLLDKKAKKGPRHYEYDPWQSIGNLNANITVKELAQIAPAVRASLQHGLRNTKPTYGTVNSVEHTARTPAYTVGRIGHRWVNIIIDTGAGICLISKKLLKKLNWTIDRPTTMALVVADGRKAIALGEMENVKVKLGKAGSIAVDMVVTNSDTYDVILGMNWLAKAQANIDVSKSTLAITDLKDNQHEIQLNFIKTPNKIIYSSDEHSSSDEEGTSAEPVYNVTEPSKKARAAAEWKKFAKDQSTTRGNHKYATTWAEVEESASSEESEENFAPPMERTTYYYHSGNYSDGDDDFWAAYDCDRATQDEEELINEAKARYFGPVWKNPFYTTDHPRSFWLANALTRDEFEARRGTRTLGTTPGKSIQEVRAQFKEAAQAAEIKRLKYVAELSGLKDPSFVPTPSNCSKHHCFFKNDQTHLRCQAARDAAQRTVRWTTRPDYPPLIKKRTPITKAFQEEREIAQALLLREIVAVRAEPTQCPSYHCVKPPGSTTHPKCALHLEWMNNCKERAMKRQMGGIAPEIEWSQYYAHRLIPNQANPPSNSECQAGLCYWTLDLQHQRCRAARKNEKLRQKIAKAEARLRKSREKPLINTPPTHTDCANHQCYWRNNHHRVCQRLRAGCPIPDKGKAPISNVPWNEGRWTNESTHWRNDRTDIAPTFAHKKKVEDDLKKTLRENYPNRSRNPSPKPITSTPPTKYVIRVEDEPDWTQADNKNWEDQVDPEWMEVRTTLAPKESSPSKYATRWQESFKKSRCPHGVRIFSPEDECLTCVIECAQPETTVNHVHQVHAPDPQEKDQELQVRVQLLNSKVGIPELSHEGDAGFDLTSTIRLKLSPGESLLVPTGLAFEIPQHYFGKIESKSGLALSGLVTRGGVIDSSYRGEVQVILENRSFREFPIAEGSKIAQIVFMPVLNKKLTLVKTPLSKTTRGKDGFGSTGVYNARQSTRDKMKMVHQDTTGDKHAYHLGKQLTESQQKTVRSIMEGHEEVLAVSFEELRHAKVKYRHHIDTQDAKPIKQAPYRLPPHYKQWVRDEIQELLKTGIIRHSKSPWSSPIVLIPKKDGAGGLAPRMCIDYRNLNGVTVRDAHPIPRISDILEYMPPKLGYFSTFDLFMGYNQVGMTQAAIERSAFVTPDGQYEYTRMPFGLCNAPATFQRVMNEVFADLIGKGLYVYIDDITIYSETFEEHMVLLKEVLRRLRDRCLYLKPKKCTIAADQVDLLGHVITRNGIQPSPTKIQAVMNYPRPANKTELRAFLGLIGYYRHFIKNCSAIIEPLSRMLQEHIKFEWNDKGIEETTFTLVKKMLVHKENLLIRPDFTKQFILQTDGSALGLGAVLSQLIDGKDRPIAYASRRTSRTESNYGATQVELLAVVWAVQHFRHYLLGAPFQLVTDHSALRALLKIKDPQGLFARWIMKLQPYDIDVVIKPGRLHQNADALSRTPHRDPHQMPRFIERLPKKGPFLPDF